MTFALALFGWFVGTWAQVEFFGMTTAPNWPMLLGLALGTAMAEYGLHENTRKEI